MIRSYALPTDEPGIRPFRSATRNGKKFYALLYEACLSLSSQICRDGEGCTKVVEIIIRGTKTNHAAKTIAQTIATSLLVKTALFGEDPNWGRILAAAGRAGIGFQPSKLSLQFNDVPVVKNGQGVGSRADRRAQRIMRKKEYAVTLTVGTQPGTARIWTTDLSCDYVNINAAYTT